jgi:hypothetical protein
MAGLLGLAKERFVLFFPVTFAALLLGREHCSLGGAYFFVYNNERNNTSRD